MHEKNRTFSTTSSRPPSARANRFTSPSRLAISGASNAGADGAAITQRPDLFRAAICGYPLLDMLRSRSSWWHAVGARIRLRGRSRRV